jgi:hypothetical protein
MKDFVRLEGEIPSANLTHGLRTRAMFSINTVNDLK